MKKILFLLTFVFGLFMVSCSNDDPVEVPDAPIVTATGLKADQTVTLTDPIVLKFLIDAPGFITSVDCTIESSTLVPYLMRQGLGASLNLANPSTAEAEFLNRNGITNGASVYGETSVLIDLSTAMPKLFDIADEDVEHKFNVTITDLYGQQLYFSFIVNQYKK